MQTCFKILILPRIHWVRLCVCERFPIQLCEDLAFSNGSANGSLQVFARIVLGCLFSTVTIYENVGMSYLAQVLVHFHICIPCHICIRQFASILCVLQVNRQILANAMVSLDVIKNYVIYWSPTS